MKIQILGTEVVDRIAAGEVLDRPANLVKELVENSLDAGASRIDVEFADGGRSVRIVDDGVGMGQEDLVLCLKRHATSKISTHDDLFRLVSYGFRGEALASIAAVSRLQVTSATSAAGQGLRLQSDFGHVVPPVPVSAPRGTQVDVRELFENVPARRKFLKSEPAEHGQIKNTLKALALSHETVGFSVHAKGQLIAHWPARQTFQDRAVEVLEADQLFAGHAENQGIVAEVLVSSPRDTMNVNRNMWFFVQGRWIQDRSLTAAVMEAYRGLLMHGEYPTVVVRVTLPPEEVDVNVHPAKSQVKFRDPQAAFRAVTHAVRAVLESAPWLPHPTSESPGPREDFSLTSEVSPEPSLRFTGGAFERTQYQTKSFPVSEVRAALAPYRVAAADAGGFRWADLQVIGQLNQTYVVAQSQDAFYLVDQHAAHERIVFEHLMEGFKAGKLEIQNLLIPLVLDFSAEEVEVLLRRKDAVERLGLTLERMGPESLAIQAIPTIVSETAVSASLQKLAFELSENAGELAWEKSVAEIFASMACHSVIRAGQSQSAEEMRHLLMQMDRYPLSSFCPHGRPVYVSRRFAELEREFGRTV